MGKNYKPVDKRRKPLSRDFVLAIRANDLDKICEEAGIVRATMKNWLDEINKADIFDIRLHQIADKLNFPKERMFR